MNRNSRKTAWLLFYGIQRAIEYTNSSIHQNLIWPLSNKYDLKIAAHFYDVKEIRNLRANEIGHLSTDAHDFFKTDFYQLDPDNKEEVATLVEKIRCFGDAYKNDFNSISNMIQSLISINRVFMMIEPLCNENDIFIFARPDVIYLDKLNTKNDFKDKWHVPDYGAHGGINDRFTVCGSKSTARSFSNQQEHILSFCKELKTPLHSEKFRLYASIKENVKIETLKFRVQRVRLGGELHLENFKSNSKARPLINYYKMRFLLALISLLFPR